MRLYKCKNCGYSGDKFVFQFNDYTYCVASNDEEPEFINCCPEWVSDKVPVGDAEIGEPVGCPECHAWGVSNFELVF
ncbi:hypothetical protein KAW65_01515 [candidate division WOR-3 bacterium]|nr:hypothetical protein [candidate division WOR-3 bacterium]